MCIRLLAVTTLVPVILSFDILLGKAAFRDYIYLTLNITFKSYKGKRKVQGEPQSQTAALPRPQEEEETDKSKQVQTEQTFEKH